MTNPFKTSKPVKILIVDDHALIRRGIMSILRNHDPGWELYEAEDGVKAIHKVRQIDPDIILLDYHMPRLNGGKAASMIKKACPNSKIIIVSMDASPEMVIEMIHAGVAGIISKQSPEDELIEAIDTVKNGKRHLSRQASEIVTKELLEKEKYPRLSKHSKSKIFTDREAEILAYIVKGLSCQEIAVALSISSRTVANHKANMFKKCSVNSTLELARFALKTKITSIEQPNQYIESK
jgi:DNA-binding NarL/FixJ family response regulator